EVVVRVDQAGRDRGAGAVDLARGGGGRLTGVVAADIDDGVAVVEDAAVLVDDAVAEDVAADQDRGAGAGGRVAGAVGRGGRRRRARRDAGHQAVGGGGLCVGERGVRLAAGARSAPGAGPAAGAGPGARPGVLRRVVLAAATSRGGEGEDDGQGPAHEGALISRPHVVLDP